MSNYMADINIDENKLVITLPPITDTRRRSTRIEKGLVVSNLKAHRPVRNVNNSKMLSVDTELDDIISEIQDLKTASLAKYEKIMEAIEEARLINNILKTNKEQLKLSEELRNDNMIEIYHELLSD